jgi:hypothetical protein
VNVTIPINILNTCLAQEGTHTMSQNYILSEERLKESQGMSSQGAIIPDVHKQEHGDVTGGMTEMVGALLSLPACGDR